MSLGNYISLSAPQYPSVSGAFKEFESGLIGLARIQEAQNTARRQELQDIESSAARRRQVELDAQTAMLNSAKEQRAADDSAMKNLMELTKMQIEREEHDLKMVELREAHDKRRKATAFMRDEGNSALFQRAQSPDFGVSAPALAALMERGALLEAPDEARDFLHKLKASWEGLPIYFDSEKTDVFSEIRRIRSGNSAERVRGAAVLLAGGATGASLTAMGLPAGEAELAQKFVGSVSVDDPTTAQMATAYKQSERELRDLQELRRAAADPATGREIDVEIRVAQRARAQAEEHLRDKGMLDASGRLIRHTDQLSAYDRGRAVTEALAPIATVGTTQHAMAFAEFYAAAEEVDSMPEGPKKKNAEALLLARPDHPEAFAQTLASLTAAIERYEAAPSAADPRAVAAIAEIVQLTSAMSPLARAAGVGAGASAATIVPEADLNIARAAEEGRERAAADRRAGKPPDPGFVSNVFFGTSVEGAPAEEFLPVREAIGLHTALTRKAIDGRLPSGAEAPGFGTLRWVDALSLNEARSYEKALAQYLRESAGVVPVTVTPNNTTGYGLFREVSRMSSASAAQLVAPIDIVESTTSQERAVNLARLGDSMFYSNQKLVAGRGVTSIFGEGRVTAARQVDGEQVGQMMLREGRQRPSSRHLGALSAAALGHGGMEDIIGGSFSETATAEAIALDASLTGLATTAAYLAAPAAVGSSGAVGLGQTALAGGALKTGIVAGAGLQGGLALSAGLSGAGSGYARLFHKMRPGDQSDVDLDGYVPGLVPLAKNGVEQLFFPAIAGTLSDLSGPDFGARINFAAGLDSAMTKYYYGSEYADVGRFLQLAGINLAAMLTPDMQSLAPGAEAAIRRDAQIKNPKSSGDAEVTRALDFLRRAVGASGNPPQEEPLIARVREIEAARAREAPAPAPAPEPTRTPD